MTEATQKQIEFAQKLGIESPQSFTKEALRELIDKKIAERDKDKPKSAENAPRSEKTYHLTPEQVRYNALDIALRRYPQLDRPGLLREAEEFEKWMNR
jgi:hypothetical protein